MLGRTWWKSTDPHGDGSAAGGGDSKVSIRAYVTQAGGKMLGEDKKMKKKQERRKEKKKTLAGAHPPIYAEDTVHCISKAGGSCSTSTRPTLNLLHLLRASV